MNQNEYKMYIYVGQGLKCFKFLIKKISVINDLDK